MATYYRLKGRTPPSVSNSLVGDACPFKHNDLPQYGDNLAALSPRGLLQGNMPNAVSNDLRDFIVGPGVTVPDPVRLDIMSVDKRTKQKASEFRKLQATGKVIVKPRHACDISALLLPGPPASTVFSGTLSRPFGDPRFDVSPLWLDEKLKPGTYCGRVLNWAQSHDDAFGIPLDGPVTTPSGRIGIMPGQRQWESGVVHSLVMPSPGVAHRAATLLYDALEKHEWDRGLITSVHAEANSGAWDLLTEMGEAKETIGWIFGLLKSGVDLVVKTKRELRNAHKRPGQSASALADEIASIWMQFRYAFSPLGYSVNDALAYFETEFKPYETFRKGSNVKVDVDFPSDWSVSDIKVRDRVFLKHRYASDYTLHNLGFNPLATAWELTPLSFVVDWLLNIGDLLSALNTPNNVIDMGCTYSRQIKDTVEFRTPEGRFELTVNYYKLTPYNPLDRVGLTMDLSMTWKRWLDAIALSWMGTKSLLK